jgi:hypothetical protein
MKQKKEYAVPFLFGTTLCASAFRTNIAVWQHKIVQPRVFKQWWWSAATSLRKGDIEGNGEGD